MAIASETFDSTGARPGWTSVRSSYAVTGYAGGVGIMPSRTSGTSNQTNGTARRDSDLGGVDQFCECDVTAPGADSDRTLFLYCRMGTGSSPAFYAAALNANASTIAFLRYSNPTSANPLVTNIQVSVPAAPFPVQFQVEGTGTTVTLRYWIGGELASTTTDTSSSRLLTGNYAGLGSYRALAVGDASAVLHVDNWRAGLLSDLAPAGPPLGQFLPFFR